jgi:hypothetical protein
MMFQDFQQGLTQFLATLGLFALVVIVIYILEQRRLKKEKANWDYVTFMNKVEQMQRSAKKETPPINGNKHNKESQ